MHPDGMEAAPEIPQPLLTVHSFEQGQETWPPCACSLQDRKLMAQDDEFQQQIKALA
jgi:hypothetical protein